eukprot:scaffold341067_cov39-Prasinocladus_malaysianus.AAC.1
MGQTGQLACAVDISGELEIPLAGGGRVESSSDTENGDAGLPSSLALSSKGGSGIQLIIGNGVRPSFAQFQRTPTGGSSSGQPETRQAGASLAR